MPPSTPRAAALGLSAIVLNLATACALGWTSAAWPLDPAVLAAVLLLFAHHRVSRWRTPSLLVAGGLGSVLLAWVVLLALSRLGLHSGWASAPYALLIAPWPGHLLARAAGALLPRTPVRIVARGYRGQTARAALASTPGSRWRLAKEGEEAAPEIPLSFVTLDDRGARLALPGGELPLHPEGPTEGMGWAVKRSMDLAGALLLLVVAGPAILALALAARLTSPGPAFYCQERITRGDRTFRIHKIRSMIVDAEPGGRPVWPEEHDPRITAFGRFLRRYWLDELPQLLDVVAGTLSLVGPRPERPAFVQAFSKALPKYPLRHQVNAGITGLAQVSGYTGNTSLARRLRLDLRYIRTWSPRLDLWILVATALRVLRRPPIKPSGGRKEPASHP